ncbi:dihydrofolate reductase family protein [Paractinoplanes durhamensis]|uniref:dihydrofolate reductase family protein n=1 Tax=Paractinoplanes durhamensis TaxID=113563 RepID=UPI00194063A6|nr:dihydrofolate reductase family protein [Actinoplanes durhamensis]
MPKTQYYTATTIDGFIADPDNSLEWLFAVEEGREDESGANPFSTFFAGVGAFAMGATTYEWILEHESLLTRPEKWQEYYQDIPAWVFTHRDLPPIPGADLTFVRGDVRPVHAAMTARAGGKNIWVTGGGELAGAFADAGLLDELILGVAPATLGAGAPLLPRRLMPSRIKLTSVEQRGQFAYLSYALGPPPA